MWIVLEKHSIEVSDKVNSLYWTMFKWPEKITQEYQTASSRLDKTKGDIVDKITEDKNILHQETMKMAEEIEFLRVNADHNKTEEMVRKVDSTFVCIKAALTLSESVKHREKLIGLPISSFDLLVRNNHNIQV